MVSSPNELEQRRAEKESAEPTFTGRIVPTDGHLTPRAGRRTCLGLGPGVAVTQISWAITVTKTDVRSLPPRLRRITS
jgi:hypothetical protein